MSIRVYIGIATAEATRHAVFYDHVNQLHKPEGTIGAGFHLSSAARNRNLIIRDALRNGCTHILFLDDDMAFGANSLTNLLNHDKDIVSGLYFNRGYPHVPVVFNFNDVYKTRYVHFLQPEERGVIEVDAVGFGFLLVKSHVFDAMGEPWVRLAELESDARNEDVGFCIRAKEQGFKIHCDLDTVIGHMGTATIWPVHDGEKWHTAIDTGGPEVFTIPQKASKNEILTPLSYEIHEYK